MIPRAEIFQRITRRYIDVIHGFLERKILVSCDRWVVAVALEPDIVRIGPPP